jgi:hypothetical protein
MHKVLLLIILLLPGCAPGLVGQVPKVADPATAGTLVVIRPWSMAGSTAALRLTLDGAEVYALGPGEHARFPVASGRRTLGAKSYRSYSEHERTHVVQIEPGQTYYFELSPGLNTPALAPLTAEAGQALMTRTKRLE